MRYHDETEKKNKQKQMPTVREGSVVIPVGLVHLVGMCPV